MAAPHFRTTPPENEDHALRPLIAGLLVAPLLAGCFAAKNDASGDGTAEGARLKVALAFPPSENFSPYGADATLLSRLGVTEGLTELDANGAAAPALAASWKQESERGWLFTLRQADFQDGTRVTPSAVASALTRAGKAKPVTAALSGASLRAEPVGDDRVRITTADSDPALPLRLSSPGLAVLSAKAYAKGDKVSPVGTATGPFELTRTTGATAATLDRFDDYWGGRAQASGVDARFIADGTARTNALRTGDVDIAEAVPVSQAASLDKGHGRETATARTTALQLNTEKGAFKDPGLRAAARAAIDTSALAEDVYEGHADTGKGIFGPALNRADGIRDKPAGQAEATAPGGKTITLGTYDGGGRCTASPVAAARAPPRRAASHGRSAARGEGLDDGRDGWPVSDRRQLSLLTRLRPSKSSRRDPTWRYLSPLLRLLILTQLAFNIGFFAVLPFLAEHLGAAIGMAGWLVGLVLGLRTFSQQGLFVVGGALTDRYGVRPVVLTGCVLRIAGFAWLGYAQQTWSVIGAVLLIGFAAALFSPAVESEVARQAVLWEESGRGPRTRVLALLTVAGQAGAFLGPLLGALLLSVDFRTVCLAGAGVFVLVLAGHLWLLPQHIPGRERTPVRGGMGDLLRNRRFLAVCCAYGAYLLAYNQLYLALPNEVERSAGSQAPLAWLFALSSLLVVTTQLPVTHWAAGRLDQRRSMVAGLALISVGFAVVAVARPAARTGLTGLLPAAGFVVLLTLGQMLVAPAARAWVPDLAPDGRLGLYTGALSSVSGLIVLMGSAATGSLLDAGLLPWVPWLALAAIPLLAITLLPGRARAPGRSAG